MVTGLASGSGGASAAKLAILPSSFPPSRYYLTVDQCSGSETLTEKYDSEVNGVRRIERRWRGMVETSFRSYTVLLNEGSTRPSPHSQVMHVADAEVAELRILRASVE